MAVTLGVVPLALEASLPEGPVPSSSPLIVLLDVVPSGRLPFEVLDPGYTTV